MPVAPRNPKEKEAPIHDEEKVLYTAAEVEQIVQERVAGLQRELADIKRADSERKQAEDALRESEEKYRSLGIQPPQTLVLMQDGRIVFVNRWAVEYGGYSEEELLAMSSEEVLQLFHPEDRLMIARCIRERLVRTDVPTRHEVRFIRRDGTVLWGDVFVNLVQYKGRSAYQILFVDITDRKRMEEALQEHLEIERALLNTPTDLSVLLDTEGIILDINDTHAQVLGKTPRELIGNTMWSFFPPDVYTWRRRLFDEALGSGKLVRVERKHNDRWYDVVVNPIFNEKGTIIRVAVIVRDITDRKRVEEALRESEERFKAFMDNSPAFAWIKDEQGRYIYLNKKYQDIGVRLEDMLGKTDRDILPLEVAQQFETNDRAVLENGQVIDVIEETPGLQGGRLFWWNFKFPLKDSSGKRYVGGIGIDITERKRVEDALRESEDRYRKLVEHSPDGICIHREGTIVYINPAGLAMLGARHPDEIIGRHVLSIVHPAYQDAIRENIQCDLREGSSPIIQLQILRLDGTLIWGEGRGSRVFIGGEPVVQVILRDISQRKKAEEDLQKYAEQMKQSNEELERFAYVASHDLKEPLRAIVSFSQILEQEYKGRVDEKGGRYIRNIVEAGNRMHALIDDLLRYSHLSMQEVGQQETSSQLALDEILAILGPQIESTGAVITHDIPPSVMMDKSQLGIIFHNLLSNALKFRKENTVPRIHISSQYCDGMVQFSVSDNGIGIEPEYIQKLFVIFERLHRRDKYTGTGIGLAIVKKIIDRHGGRIWVESEPGKGSTFHFTIPATKSGQSL